VTVAFASYFSEIRSARESECYQKAKLLETVLPDVEFFQKSARWLNERCVREHAVRSTSVRCRFGLFDWCLGVLVVADRAFVVYVAVHVPRGSAERSGQDVWPVLRRPEPLSE
jgi:hypothetical protein